MGIIHAETAKDEVSIRGAGGEHLYFRELPSQFQADEMNLPMFKDAVFIKRVSELHEQLWQCRLGGSCC